MIDFNLNSSIMENDQTMNDIRDKIRIIRMGINFLQKKKFRLRNKLEEMVNIKRLQKTLESMVINDETEMEIDKRF